MLRVVVTGASGLIGDALCEALLARGDDVVGLSRDPDRAAKEAPKVNWHRWDATSERPPQEALAGADAIVNLIGESLDQRLTNDAKRRILESREVATRNLVSALAGMEERPAALVSQSAVGYYGEHGTDEIDESTGPGEDFPARVCQAWETAAKGGEELGVRVAITRSGPVLTPEGGLLKRLLLPFRLGLGGPLAGGEQYMPWIHIEDEVGMLTWAIDNEKARGAINAIAPSPVTNREFAKALGAVLRRPALLPTPRFAISAALGSELAEAVTVSLRVIPKRALELGYSFQHPELEPALRDLLD